MCWTYRKHGDCVSDKRGVEKELGFMPSAMLPIVGLGCVKNGWGGEGGWGVVVYGRREDLIGLGRGGRVRRPRRFLPLAPTCARLAREIQGIVRST